MDNADSSYVRSFFLRILLVIGGLFFPVIQKARHKRTGRFGYSATTGRFTEADYAAFAVSRRTARESIKRVKPETMRLMPNRVPITQSAFSGQ